VEKKANTLKEISPPQNEDDFWMSKGSDGTESATAAETDEVVDEEEDETQLVTLRVDNVPWDITPPALLAYLNAPAGSRAHVLLDNRGKTRSHAYAQVPAARARAALRGQGLGDSALGTGKRRRGVVITRSGVADLVSDVRFPFVYARCFAC
jgi:hypothetical protein